MKYFINLIILLFLSISNAFGLNKDCLNLVNDYENLKDSIVSEIQQEINDATSIELIPYGNFPTHAKDLCVRNIKIDTRGYNFYANINIDSRNYLFQGKFKFLSLIPVLNSDILKDSVITENDVDLVPLTANKVMTNTVRDKSLIIGMAAKINLKADKPINLRELYKPILIKKNELINVIFKKSNVQIKMTGVALEDGTKNDIVKVKNARSGQIITAIVTDLKTALVQ